MSEQQHDQSREPTEEELRAAYEQQLKQIRVEDVLVQTVLSLINLGSLRAGLVPGNESEADPQQLRAGDRGRAGAAAAGRAGPRARRAPDPRRGLAPADGVRAPGRRRRRGDDGPPAEGAEPAPEAAPQGAPQPSEPGGSGAGAEQRQALGSGALTPGARRVRRRPR